MHMSKGKQGDPGSRATRAFDGGTWVQEETTTEIGEIPLDPGGFQISRH